MDDFNPVPFNLLPKAWAFDPEIGAYNREILNLLRQLKDAAMSSEQFSALVTRGGTEYTLVHKFGANTSVGTSFEPVTKSNVYRTKLTSQATTLRVKAGNANDTAAGSGAREITLIGLDETGAEVTEAIATAGASASSSTTTTFMRLYRAYVSASGSYATSAIGSHSGDIVIENTGGTEDWLIIDASNGFPLGQSEVGAYTVPLGKTALVRRVEIEVETAKTIDVLFFQRQGILKTAAPFDAMRVVEEWQGITDRAVTSKIAPLGPFPELTDIGFLAKASTGSAEVAVSFEIWLY